MLYGTHEFLVLRGNQSTTMISHFLDPDPNHLLKKKLQDNQGKEALIGLGWN